MNPIAITLIVLLSLLFLLALSYLLYLKAHGRDLDEEDCHIGKRDSLKAYLAQQKKRERKLALKKKRELEKLDRQESKRNLNT